MTSPSLKSTTSSLPSLSQSFATQPHSPQQTQTHTSTSPRVSLEANNTIINGTQRQPQTSIDLTGDDDSDDEPSTSTARSVVNASLNQNQRTPEITYGNGSSSSNGVGSNMDAMRAGNPQTSTSDSSSSISVSNPHRSSFPPTRTGYVGPSSNNNIRPPFPQHSSIPGPSFNSYQPQSTMSPSRSQFQPQFQDSIDSHSVNPANWAAQFAPNFSSTSSNLIKNDNNNINNGHSHGHSTPSTPSGSGPSRIGLGVDASSAIDLTSHNLPSPPPPPPSSSNDKKPLCIGSLLSAVIMLYPCPAVVQGALPPPGSKERYDVVDFKGAEMLKVKLKYRQRGTSARKDDPNSVLPADVIQVMTPGLSTYIGDLDPRTAGPLINFMSRGLLRLEGFVQRLQPEAPQFQVRINVLLFTLPSNVQYIANDLSARTMYLLDPVPVYDPSRHSDRPRYENAHGGGQAAYQMYIIAQRRAAGIADGYGLGMTMADRDRDRATKIEIDRRQIDDVFKGIDDGTELEQCDPGPLIKTNLFPHQRKALTFMLQREQDFFCLKQSRKNAKKLEKKSKSTRAASVEAISNDGDSVKGKEKEKEKEREKDERGSLWEGMKDDKGRIRAWKHKITSEVVKGKKGEKPEEGKGAILADDMGLGKTLCVVSLIAATRSSAHDWAKSKLSKSEAGTPEPEKDSSDIKPSEFRTKVFGMPVPSVEEEGTDAKGKKRKFEESSSCRRSRIVCRSKATLLVCPMSTIANWEEQMREHWNGEVEIVGGAAGVMPPKKIERKWKPPKKDGEESSDDDLIEGFDKLRVYIYHGPSRRPDPLYISDFDVVITSYTTLGNEFSKQTGVTETEVSTPGDAEDSAEDGPGDIKPSDVEDALKKGGKKGKSRQKTMTGSDHTSPLQAIDWFRVVLDEAHTIKSPVTVQSQAACAVEADRRIALTGTPIQNKIDDVWALFKFLRLTPIDDKKVFQDFILTKCKSGEPIGVARLQLIMRCCTLRRTKDSTAEDGQRILNLPPRKEVQLWLDLREDERKVYDERASVAKAKLSDIRATKGLERGYSNMLQDILRLRQICNHVDLAMLGPVEEDYDGTIMDYQVALQGIEQNGLTQARAVAVVCFQKDGDGAVCVGCNYDYGDHFPDLALGGGDDGLFGEKSKLKKLPHKPVLTKCLHLYCPGCFKSQVFADYTKKSRNNVARSCGSCSSMLRLPNDIIEVVPPDQADTTDLLNGGNEQSKKPVRKRYVRPPGEKPNLSTKMQYLHDELLALSKKNPHSPHYDPFSIAGDGDDVEELDAEGKPFVTKSVVFSQWTTMLDRIADMLVEAKIGYSRLDGTMTREDRTKAIEQLKYGKKTEVILVSTRAGGVGINLTTASRCYLIDPYWNPSVENQAIDRIHRMGQTRPVLAVRLMIKDSIEEKLDKIQKKKANLAQLSLSKLSHKEILAQRAEELVDLFS